MAWKSANDIWLWISPDFFFTEEYLFHTRMRWKSYNSEIRTDHAEFDADDFCHG